MAARWPNLAPRWDWPKMANLSRKSERGGVGPVAAGATGNGRKTPLGQELDRIWKGFGKGFDTRLKHARPPLCGGGGSKTPAASTAGPFLSSLAFSVSPLWKIKTGNENLRKICPESLKKSSLKGKKSMPGGGLGALGGDLGKKNDQEPVLADFGRFETGAGCSKWRQDGRTWRQDGTKMAPRWPKRGLGWSS